MVVSGISCPETDLKKNKKCPRPPYDTFRGKYHTRCYDINTLSQTCIQSPPFLKVYAFLIAYVCIYL